MRYDIDTESAVPVHHQLRQFILLEILSGRLKEGDKLPPIREMAKILRLNPNTVAKVYYNLDNEGFVRGKIGSGYTVMNQKSKMDKLKASMLEEEFKNFLEKAFLMGFSKEDVENLMRRLLNHE